MLKIHETTTPSGKLLPVFLDFDAGVLSMVDETGANALPSGALDAVMSRFGGSLDADANASVVATLDLGNDCTLRHIRHLDRYDVIARDYLVYQRPGREPLCALATTVVAALAHLARAARDA